MLWIVLYGCGMGLQPMEKISDTSDTTIFEPGSEPDGMPSNEPSIDPLEVDDDGDWNWSWKRDWEGDRGEGGRRSHHHTKISRRSIRSLKGIVVTAAIVRVILIIVVY